MNIDDVRARRRAFERRRKHSKDRLPTSLRRARSLLAPERLERRDTPAQMTLGSLILEGTFVQSGSQYSASGPVDIGYAPTGTENFYPLTVWNGDLSFTSGGSSFNFSGTVDAIEQSTDVAVADVGTTQNFTIAALTGAGINVSGETVSVLGATLTPTMLAFVDPAGGDTTGSYVSLQGSLGFAQLAGLSVPVSSPNFVEISPAAAAPGLTLAAATTTTSFDAFDVDFSSVSVSAGYSTTDSAFEISGSVGVATASGDLTASGSLGTASAPGLIINSTGSVTALSVTLSADVSTYGLNIDADGLSFAYQIASTNEYEIQSGTITASDSAGDFSFAGSFGAGGQPGLVVTGGSLTSLNATLNGSATASGLSVTASDDVLQFSAATPSSAAQFAIDSGSLTVGSSTASVSFGAEFGVSGSPGLVLQGGSLTAFNVAVDGSMSVAGLSIAANGIAFTYSESADTFGIAAGSITVSATDMSFTGVFGSGSTPGLTMNGATLTEVDITVNTQIDLQGLTLSVDDLQFVYEDDVNSIYNGDFLIDSGDVTIATSADDTFFAATFGSGANPGLVIANGSLSALYATVSATSPTISAQGLVINAAGLVFQYEGGSQTFEIATGSVSVTSGSVQFGTATFGASGTPGLTIQNGVLTGLDISISSSMTVDGMSLSISNLQLIYDAVSGQTYGDFEIAAGGTVSLSAGPADNALTFEGTFGDTQSSPTIPGLSLSDGVLQSFYIGITTSSSLGGLTITTTGLTFSYDTSSQTFEIVSGSVSVTDTNNDFNFTGTFGATQSGGTTVPGLVVSNGSLSALNVTITSQFTASALTFDVTNLDFIYNAAENQYEIDSGSLSFNTSEGFSFSADFDVPDPSNPSSDLPGLVIVGGALTEFNATLTTSFTVAGLVVDVNSVSMVYDSGEFEMDGTVTVSTSNVSFTGTIGQPTASPQVYGLIIDNGSLQSLAITINSNVTFGSLTLQAQNLAFNYDASPESFTLYGTVTTSIAGVTLTGTLGTQSSPGLSIVNGQLTELNLGVTTDFTLFGLQCNVQDLTFLYETQDGDTDYILYGSLSLSISGESLSAQMGTTPTDAGLIIQNGVVTQINMTINGTFGIGGFGFQIVDAGLDYTSTADEYLIFGTFTLTDVFSASVQLGTGSSNPGITVINGVFELDNFAFTLSNVPIGGFTLNYVTISYASVNDVWSGSAMVTFPTGWSISASMTFVEGVLDDISLAYNAGTSQGIEIPDTGVYVTEISGSLENLDEPASIIVSGTIQAVYGGKITIGGTSCTIFAATGSFTSDSQQLEITGNFYLGAYQTNGNWHGILGTGTASVDLDWAAGVYTASESESLFDGTFVISAEMAFDDSGNLAIDASASVNVPDAVPFIGGTQLGSMQFAFIYNFSSNSGSGTVAAWCSVNCYFTTVTTGFEYTFNSTSSGTFSLIGAGGVNNIENEFNTISSADASTPPVYVYTYQVTVPSGSGANGLSVQASWPSNDGTQSLYISGPNDNGTYYSATSTGLPSTDDFLSSYTTSTSQSVMTTGSSTSTSVLLPVGTYNFEIQSTYEFASSSDVTFTNQLYYEAPSVAITSVPTSALSFVPSMTGFAAGALTLGTTITLYAQSSSTGYNGKPVGSFLYSVNSSGQLQNVSPIDLSSYSPGVPIYIYAMIDDGVNTAVYSALSAPVIPVPNLVGQVTDQFSNPIAGLRVFLDLNDDGTYDAPVTNSSGAVTQAGDPSAITNASGDYYFNNLQSYSTTDIGYPTFRVMALMPSASFTPITPSNDVDTINESSVTEATGSTTGSLVANFSVNRLASISGSLYSDLNQNGVYVSTDPALGGATVYLDSSGTGTYQAGDPTCITGPSGTFGFYDLNPTSYTTGILTSTTANNVTTNVYVVTQPSSGTYTIPVTSDAQQLTGYTFGVISLATISGTVSSETTSTTTPLAGATIDLSTPNTSANPPNYNNFAGGNNLKLTNSSVTSSGTLAALGASQSNVATSTWYKPTVPVTGGFETSFPWTLTSTAGSAGGFAFVLQNDSTSALGTTAYGYGGITNSLAVIFDAADNQVLIETGGYTSASSALAVLTSAQLGFTLDSGTLYTARITYLPSGAGGAGNLNVYLSGDSSGGLTPVATIPINLSTVLNLGSSANPYFGFTGGASGTGIAASIQSWSTTALTTQWTTSNASGNYSFTGLMPQLSYTLSQVPPSGYVQATPSNTKGVYSQETMSATGQVDSSVATGDFNGDGIPDIAYASSLDDGTPFQITYAYGNGSGGFDTPITMTIPLTLPAPALATPSNGAAFDAFIVAGHFTSTAHDQIAYIATMASGGQVVVVYDSDLVTPAVVDEFEVESTTAPATANGVTTGYAGTINNVAVGDLNNDGYDDLAVSTYAGVYTIVSLQSLPMGTSWLVNPTTLATPLTTPTLISSSAVAYNAGVALADFNQDGNLDLVSMGVQYVPSVTKEGAETKDNWSDMTVDTTIQLAYGTGNGFDYTVQSQATFQSYSSSNIDTYISGSSTAPTYPIPFGMAAADISGDGIPDLVLNGYTSTLQPAVFLLTQSAPGTFTPSGTIDIPNGKSFNVNGTPGPDNTVLPSSMIVPAQVVALDLNEDGYNDVAAVDPNVGQLMILTTSVAPLTAGQTQNMQELAGGALPQFVVADFNNDGYPDMLVPGENNNPSQSAPVEILNGTINVGVITVTPTNGQVIYGQNFVDINYNSSTIAASAVTGGRGVSGNARLVGQVFLDNNGNGRISPHESALSGLIVYLDTNGSGTYDPDNDPHTTTNALGYYEFTNLVPGRTYTIRVAGLNWARFAEPVTLTMPSSRGSVLITRDLAVTQRLFVPQPARTVNPLSPLAIDLAPMAFRLQLNVKPMYSFVGNVPEGMTINPYTGLIQWTPSINEAGSTVVVTVRVTNTANRSALETQTAAITIHVNAVSTLTSYIESVYGVLLRRLPTSSELAEWSSRLQSGTSRLAFVEALGSTNERYTVLANAVYWNVLSRRPTAAELAAALVLFRNGGNSDQLTQALLVSPSFIAAHTNPTSYVTAVNELLTYKLPSAATLRSEVARLKRGGSRLKLVHRIASSEAALLGRVKQLARSYGAVLPASGGLAQWSDVELRLKLNSDALLERMLASTAFVAASRTRNIANVQAPTATSSPRYNELNHLVFAMTGSDAARSELDALEAELFAGDTWNDVALSVYNSAPAFAHRVESEYEDMLHRRATPAELARLEQSLPPANQSDALLVQLLSGSEYRDRFATTSAYVDDAYHVLTGANPSPSTLSSWVARLNRGASDAEFVASVNASKAGKTGQIDRAYADYLLRNPSQLELDRWLRVRGTAGLQDRAIALSIADSPEFHDEQRTARLLPDS